MAEASDSGLVSLLATGVAHLRAAKYFILASFVALVYDHMISFSDEVDRIWQRQWTGATWLFALNRYFAELVSIVNLVSFNDPYWTGKACDHFLPFSGFLAMISTGTVGIIFILRTYALYQRSLYVLVFLMLIWCGHMIVMGTALHNLHSAQLPAGLVGCFLGQNGKYAAAFWLAPLAMDTVIFILTVLKTMKYIRQNRARVPLLDVILRDGTIYFFVAFGANVVKCLVYYLAEPFLKAVAASFSQTIIIVMVSRLQLNLRSDSVCPPDAPTGRPSSHFADSKLGEHLSRSAGTSTISSFIYFFESSVADLGRDILIPDDEQREKDLENSEPLERRGDTEVRPQTRIHDAETEIEMEPILPVDGGSVTQDRSLFSPEGSEWSESQIRVSSAVAGDQSVGRIQEEIR